MFEEIAGRDDLMRIGAVARWFGVNPQTIRNWEDRGDLACELDARGFHCYRESAVRELTAALEYVRALEDAGIADGILRCRKCGDIRARRGCTVLRNGRSRCAA